MSSVTPQQPQPEDQEAFVELNLYKNLHDLLTSPDKSKLPLIGTLYKMSYKTSVDWTTEESILQDLKQTEHQSHEHDRDVVLARFALSNAFRNVLNTHPVAFEGFLEDMDAIPDDAIEIRESEKEIWHRFAWKSSPSETGGDKQLTDAQDSCGRNVASGKKTRKLIKEKGGVVEFLKSCSVQAGFGDLRTNTTRIDTNVRSAFETDKIALNIPVDVFDFFFFFSFYFSFFFFF
jgi:hypothetical protein